MGDRTTRNATREISRRLGAPIGALTKGGEA
jgi:hypothetical protein